MKQVIYAISFMILISVVIADESNFYYNINSSGETEIDINLTFQQDIYNNYYENNYITKKTSDAESGGLFVAKAIEEYFSDGFFNLDKSKQRIIRAIYGFVSYQFMPMIKEANNTATFSLNYNIENEKRIFELQQRVYALEQSCNN